MMKFPTTSLKTLVAIAALSLLTAAKQAPTPAPAPDPAPAPADAVYQADACPGSADDTIDEKRVKLIPGMI